MRRDLLDGILESYYEEELEEMNEKNILNMLKEKISEDVISHVLNLPIEKVAVLGKMNGLL